MNRRVWSILSVIAALLGWALIGPGCGPEQRSSDSHGQATAEQPTQGGFVHVQVRAAHHWAQVGRPERTDLELWAEFVHYWGGEAEDVAHTLGIAPAEASVNPGRCALVTPAGALPVGDWDAGDEELSVELLDAGSVVVSLPGHTELMTGSPYPELLPGVTGQYYRHAWTARAEGVSTRRASVYSLGEGDVPAFELSGLRGPEEVRFTAVAGWRPGEGPVVHSRREALSLRWQPRRTEFETRVRLRWSGSRRHAGGELLCRPRRGGRMTVPARGIGRIPVGRRGTRVRLSVETTARSENPGPLPGPTEVRLTQSDNLAFLLVP